MSDNNNMENVPLVRINCEVLTAASGYADIFNRHMRVKKEVIDCVEIGIM